MRWWLALAFAAIAALTALAVVWVASERAETAARRHAEEFALGNAFAAALAVGSAPADEVAARVRAVAGNRRISLYLFDAHGEPLSPLTSRGVAFEEIESAPKAVTAALGGERYVDGSEDGSRLVVGLPFGGGSRGALVAYQARPLLGAQLGIFRGEAWKAALWAIVGGAAVGLLVATFVARRLGRIARGAETIAAGHFDRPVVERFPDEVGALARSIDEMRVRLSGLVTALREDKERFETLVGRLNEAVVVFGSDLRVQYANRRAAEFAGRGEIAAGERLEMAWPDEIETYALGLVAGNAPPEPVLVEVGDRVLLVSGVPPGRLDEAILVLTDLTDRERADRAQREFVTNAAHELRTPVSVITTAIEMLQTGAKDVPADREMFLGHIEREANRLTRLSAALLVLARVEARQEEPAAEPVAMQRLLRRVADDVLASPDVRVEVDCEHDVVAASDARLIEQALQSVAANAAKYTDVGTIAFRGRTLGDRVLLEVADTGCGIDPRVRDRIFGRFSRGEGGRGGFGLGLAIAEQSVRAAGGTIAIRSDGGSGTSVMIELPAASEVPV